MLIGIISPYSGDTAANLTYLRQIMAAVLVEGYAPVAGHAMYTQPGVLDDNDLEQRMQGIAAGQELYRVCDVVRVYTERGISDGMWADIEFCRKICKPLYVFCIAGGIELTEGGYKLLSAMRPNGMRVQPIAPQPQPTAPKQSNEPVWRKSCVNSDYWLLEIGNCELGGVWRDGPDKWIIKDPIAQTAIRRTFAEVKELVDGSRNLHPCRVIGTP